MRISTSTDPNTQRRRVNRLCRRVCVVLAAAALLGAGELVAQTAPPPPAAAPAHKARKPSPKHLRAEQTPAAPVEQAPAPEEPAKPNWPVNDTPGKPSVTWDSQGLKIAATNSSLRQIMDQVSSATGTQVEGMASDQRVFGEYGPGQARDVLSQLLVGSGYNVLMIGDQGEGTPRQIVLSVRRSGKAGPAANRQSQDAQDDEVPEQPEPEEVPQPPQMMNRPPILQQGPPGAPRTPQQVLQDLQQRQQQMQDPQQPNQQPVPPPQ
ncbi:MAG TPA: hypothetical protein VGG85_03865 [Terracidiphilus sp.]|jgi:hypothetical protein